MSMDLLDIRYWAGTDEALAVYLAVARRALQGEQAPMPVVAGRMQDQDTEATEPERQSRLLNKTGDIAVIKIAGPLNNTDSWMNEWRGMTGYPEIREALVQAATDTTVSAVILDINSGGGAVTGCFDTGNLIKQVDKIKPVHAFSDGVVCSAAYLLACSARSVNIGKMTEAGSIGVVSVHQEISKMLEEAGVNVKVLRAGKYKALGNPYEPLSKLAEEESQAHLDQMYGVFVDYVAERRKASYDVADKKMAQGRVFVGEKALEVGLVDAVTSFDALASKVQGGIDSKKAQSKYAPHLQQGRLVPNALTEQQVAALALGAGGAPAADAAPGAPAVEQPPVTQPEQPAVAPTATEAAAQAAAAASASAPDAVTTLLQAQLSESQAKVIELSVEITGLKAQAEKDKASMGPFRAIAEMSVSRLRVALNAGGVDVKGMTNEALLAEQAALEAKFNEKFKAGGVAAVTPAANDENTNAADPANDPRRKARIAATRTK